MARSLTSSLTALNAPAKQAQMTRISSSEEASVLVGRCAAFAAAGAGALAVADPCALALADPCALAGAGAGALAGGRGTGRGGGRRAGLRRGRGLADLLRRHRLRRRM